MALFSTASPQDAFEDILDQERQAILAGRIDLLQRLGIQKNRLLGRLPGPHATGETLAHLRMKVERNQRLLEASARGIRAAADRLADVAAQSPALRTYGRDGASSHLNRARPDINKRA